MNRSCGVVVGGLRFENGLLFGGFSFFFHLLASMTHSLFQTRRTKLFFTVGTGRQTPGTDRFFAAVTNRRTVVAGGEAAVTESDALPAERAIATTTGIDVVVVDAGIALATGRAVPAVKFDERRTFAVGVQHAVDDLKQVGETPLG